MIHQFLENTVFLHSATVWFPATVSSTISGAHTVSREKEKFTSILLRKRLRHRRGIQEQTQIESATLHAEDYLSVGRESRNGCITPTDLLAARCPVQTATVPVNCYRSQSVAHNKVVIHNKIIGHTHTNVVVMLSNCLAHTTVGHILVGRSSRLSIV